MDSRLAGIRSIRIASFEEFNFTYHRKTKSVLRHDALETSLRFFKDRLQVGGAESSSAAASTRRDA